MPARHGEDARVLRGQQTGDDEPVVALKLRARVVAIHDRQRAKGLVADDDRALVGARLIVGDRRGVGDLVWLQRSKEAGAVDQDVSADGVHTCGLVELKRAAAYRRHATERVHLIPAELKRAAGHGEGTGTGNRTT